MLILLPPSETKRDGGADGSALDLAALSFPRLAAPRRAALAELRALSTNLSAAAVALKLGPKGAPEAAKNRVVRSSPVMPAIDRFDGVLFDALDAATLTPEARTRAAERVAIHSALFGFLGALDAIPSYRLSHDSRLPGRSLASIWRVPLAQELERVSGLIIDLRSDGYAALGPLPARDDAVTVRVLSEDVDGRRRALNHFNKHAKGELTRALLTSATVPSTVKELLDWADAAGLRLEPMADRPRELAFVV